MLNLTEDKFYKEILRNNEQLESKWLNCDWLPISVQKWLRNFFFVTQNKRWSLTKFRWKNL